MGGDRVRQRVVPHEPGRPDTRWWFTVGGGVEQGEDLRAAALRELAE
ncbi:MAG TPA: NUDIX domain-containing protein, partial [Actinophytocola sp.]